MTDKVLAFTVLNLLVGLIDGKQYIMPSTGKKHESKAGQRTCAGIQGVGAI